MLGKPNKVTTVGLTKKQIRSKILLRLKTQKEENRDRKSIIIKKKLFGWHLFLKAKIVMFYISFGGEVNTKEMIKAAKNLGKIVAVPVCRQNRIRPCILEDNAKLKKGPYGISEPVNKKFIRFEDLDLVVVPAVAFDKQGNRLGRGKGCYDWFIKKLSKKTITVGLAFGFQILPSLPTTPTDASIDKVIFA